MARITVEDCLVRENNRFALVQLASKRTKQLLTGSTPQSTERKNKAVVTALREIAEGKVRFMTPEEVIAYEEQRARELEAARAASEAEREKRASTLAASIFTNGGKEGADLRDALFGPAPTAAAGDDDDDDEE